jgi:hypothetical protein
MSDTLTVLIILGAGFVCAMLFSEWASVRLVGLDSDKPGGQ